MADLVSMHVTGVKELNENLRRFQSDAMLGKAVKAALQAGGRIPRTAAARNARALGLGYIGFKRTKGRGEEARYGRIPRAMKVGRAYIPQNAPNEYRVNVVARTQKTKGIFPNKAPHAHLVEYGFNHKGGYRIAGRPFAGPAIEATAAQVIKAVGDNVAKRVDKMQFPTTGKP